MQISRVTAIVVLATSWAAAADALELIGQVGILGEWELTANVNATANKNEFAGPITLKHVGVCTQDGPETKAGEITLQLRGASRIQATLLIDGSPCAYSGTKSDSYSGMMSCPDRRDVPLRLWMK